MTTITMRAAALQWCPFASQALGWQPAEFWRATPGELAMALSQPISGTLAAAPSREQIKLMMERDAHG